MTHVLPLDIVQVLRLMALSLLLLVVPCAMTHVLPLGIGGLGDEQVQGRPIASHKRLAMQHA